MAKLKIILLFPLLVSACVTVNLSGGKTEKAEGVVVTPPAKPFEAQSRDDVDAAWKNSKNGNVISYLSDCKDPSDPPLDQIVAGVLSGIANLKIESSSSPNIQGREARRVSVKGNVDGVSTYVELLVFKRNSCIYILNYAGVAGSAAENQKDFNRFIEGFRAP